MLLDLVRHLLFLLRLQLKQNKEQGLELDQLLLLVSALLEEQPLDQQSVRK
jgi:hypothetical protein